MSMERILIANRGEIADRIQKTVKAMGLRPIIVYTDADAETLAVKNAEEAVRIGAGPVGDSYLDQEKLLRVAKETRARAIHPGYGFLSENAAFARKVRDAGLIWIGPTPEAMEKVASKSQAKIVATHAGVPVLSGHQGTQDLGAFKEAAGKLGYPVLLKATAGGGGRGIRRVEREEELSAQLEIARSEARNAFGDDEILLEKFITEAHHIEVQVFGDSYGNVVHLFERDCSAQRKNQKVIEETPSPAISEELRQTICTAAVSIARTAGYTNAGTVEFLVTPGGDYFFLEMNTRLQVEHPVTEAVTLQDLVEWQIRIARGELLPLKQEEITTRGHAIELRLYAEDPADGMRPQTGHLRGFSFPDVRVDHFLTPRTVVTPFYDSMLAKIVVTGKDREEARRGAVAALEETLLWGLKTNANYLRTILESGFFRSGKTFVRSLESISGNGNLPGDEFNALELVAALKVTGGGDSWSNSSGRKQLLALSCGEQSHLLEAVACGQDVLIKGPSRERLLEKFSFTGTHLHYSEDGEPRSVPYLRSGEDIFLLAREVRNRLYENTREKETADPDTVLASMDGTVVKVLKKRGDAVKIGDVIAILEAMKMQTEHRSPRDGVLDKVLVKENEMIRNRQIIATLKKENP